MVPSMLKKKWMALIIVALVVAPILIQGAYIARYGVNSLIADEWETVPFVQQVFSGGNWLGMLFAQHNEHRIATFRLVLAAMSRLTGWNTIAEMFLSLLVQCLMLPGLWLIYKRVCGDRPWGFIPLAWLVFSLGQYANFLMGMQIHFYLMTLCAVWAIYFLSRITLPSLLMAVLLAVCASFSNNAGLLIWPAGLVFLILAWRVKGPLSVWAIAAVATFVLYYRNYEVPVTLPSVAFAQPFNSLQFFLANAGASLGGGISISAWQSAWV
jgi:hypothetical protein